MKVLVPTGRHVDPKPRHPVLVNASIIGPTDYVSVNPTIELPGILTVHAVKQNYDLGNSFQLIIQVSSQDIHNFIDKFDIDVAEVRAAPKAPSLGLLEYATKVALKMER